MNIETNVYAFVSANVLRIEILPSAQKLTSPEYVSFMSH